MVLSKRYYYNKAIGKQVTYEFAVENNIWGEIQNLPIQDKMVNSKINEFFDGLVNL